MLYEEKGVVQRLMKILTSRLPNAARSLSCVEGLRRELLLRSAAAGMSYTRSELALERG